MVNNLIFSAKKEVSRIEYLKRSILTIGLMMFFYIVTPILEHRTSNPKFSLFFCIAFGAIALIDTLTDKIYYSIKINYEKKEIEIMYLSLFKNNCKINIPFEKLKFEYLNSLTSSRSATKKWTLKMWCLNKLVFEIKQSKNGFEKEQLDEIFEHLSKIE
ncbi:hypothetical protein JE952_002420 [Flavobacterium psychrophilum]|uniref:hypothetical protein n=1 Tax=Flavobacterium psychrophilum TaxID=96345 RepID=UPI001068F510|nr:hypothetical protein [Flavobacterium psychrophilum]EKT4550764.1 hypothetical protein [Flavobacterium psychrophilum]ELI6456119.1 hypothetical protein [Flavobacterium psychrophilum]